MSTSRQADGRWFPNKVGDLMVVTKRLKAKRKRGGSAALFPNMVGTVTEIHEPDWDSPSSAMLDQLGPGAYGEMGVKTYTVNFPNVGEVVFEHEFFNSGDVRRVLTGKELRHYNISRLRDQMMKEEGIRRYIPDAEMERIISRNFGPKFLDKQFHRLAATQNQTQVKAAKVARRFVASAVIVGDIFVSSWGYDQTNVDYYQVVKTTKTMIVLRQINKRVVGGKGQPQEQVMPNPNDFHKDSPPLRKRLSEYNGRPFVKIKSYAYAYKWDGKPQSQTGGAYGH